MFEKIKIDNTELIVILNFNDDEYGKIKLCMQYNGKKVFVIDQKIIDNTKIIDEINKRYMFELPKEYKDIIN